MPESFAAAFAYLCRCHLCNYIQFADGYLPSQEMSLARTTSRLLSTEKAGRDFILLSQTIVHDEHFSQMKGYIFRMKCNPKGMYTRAPNRSLRFHSHRRSFQTSFFFFPTPPERNGVAFIFSVFLRRLGLFDGTHGPVKEEAKTARTTIVSNGRFFFPHTRRSTFFRRSPRSWKAGFGTRRESGLWTVWIKKKNDVIVGSDCGDF